MLVRGTGLTAGVEDARIQSFIRQTAAARDLACTYLKQADWDVNAAVATYNRLHLPIPTFNTTPLIGYNLQPDVQQTNQIPRSVTTPIYAYDTTLSEQLLGNNTRTNGVAPGYSLSNGVAPGYSIANGMARYSVQDVNAQRTAGPATAGACAIPNGRTQRKTQPPSDFNNVNYRAPYTGDVTSGKNQKIQASDGYSGSRQKATSALAIGQTASLVGSSQAMNDQNVKVMSTNQRLPRTPYLETGAAGTSTKPYSTSDVQQGSAYSANNPMLSGGVSSNNGGPAGTPSVTLRSLSDPPNFTSAPKLMRGFSRTSINQSIVSMARDMVLRDIDLNDGEASDEHLLGTSEFAFTLPDLRIYPEDLKAFLYKDLIETSTMVSLEQSGLLNWWADIGVCQRLFPMVTSGDGNCLLHAASIAMWGFHDRMLILRRALCNVMLNSKHREAFRRRWRWQTALTNSECGLILSEQEWANEWDCIVRMSSAEPRSISADGLPISMTQGNRSDSNCSSGYQSSTSSVTYESLEELHVFVLAHVLRRPIIVVAKRFLSNVHGEPLAPIPFGGIYLPLERDPAECHRGPLLLTYDSAHFCALVSMEEGGGGGGEGKGGESGRCERERGAPVLADAIPLVTPELDILPIHFLLKPEDEHEDVQSVLRRTNPITREDKLDLLREYMDIINIPVNTGGGVGEEGMTHWGAVVGGGVGGGRVRTNLERTDSDHSGRSGGSGDGGAMVGCGGGGEKTKKKTVGKQIVNVKKSIESFGKAIKNVNKQPPLQRRPSIAGTVTQSTRFTLSELPGAEAQSILCASLQRRKVFYVDDLVRNYLESAKARFYADQSTRQQRHAEIRRLSLERASWQRPVSLPPRMHEYNNRQPRIVIGQDEFPPEIGRPIEGDYDDCISNCSSSLDRRALGLPRQNTLLMTGKSKFYMNSEEDHSLSPATETRLITTRAAERENAFRRSTLPHSLPVTLEEADEVFPQTTNQPSSQTLFDASTLNTKPKNRQTTGGLLNGHMLVSQSYSLGFTAPTATSNQDPANRMRLSAAVSTAAADSTNRFGSSGVAKAFADPQNYAPSVGHASAMVDPANRVPFIGNAATSGSSERLVDITGSSSSSSSLSSSSLCRTPGCTFHGTPAQLNLCSTCFKKASSSAPPERQGRAGLNAGGEPQGGRGGLQDVRLKRVGVGVKGNGGEAKGSGGESKGQQEKGPGSQGISTTKVVGVPLGEQGTNRAKVAQTISGAKEAGSGVQGTSGAKGVRAEAQGAGAGKQLAGVGKAAAGITVVAGVAAPSAAQAAQAQSAQQPTAILGGYTHDYCYYQTSQTKL